MAIVTVAAFLPEDDSYTCIGRLHDGVSVSKPDKLIGGPTELLLSTNDGYAVRLSVDYNDVVFKFECFGLMVTASSLAPCSSAVEVTQFNDWQNMKCLFRFEWERPALAGEVPVQWEQVIRRRGRRSDISSAATAIGVSMVGIAFWNSKKAAPVASISNDDEDPMTLRICRKPNEIEMLMAECECVSLEDAKPWTSDLRSWIRSRPYRL